MTPSRILETILYVPDLDAAEAFYRDALRLEPFARLAERHVFYKLPEQMLLIFNPVATNVPPKAGALPIPAHGMTGAGHVCFAASAPEIDRWRAHLKSRGIAIEADFEWPQGGRSLYFRDPSGNVIEFAEPRIWGLK